jgi:hypothetical protein
MSLNDEKSLPQISQQINWIELLSDGPRKIIEKIMLNKNEFATKNLNGLYENKAFAHLKISVYN